VCCTLLAYTEFTNYCCRLLISLEFCFKACTLGVCLMQKHRLQDVYATVWKFHKICKKTVRNMKKNNYVTFFWTWCKVMIKQNLSLWEWNVAMLRCTFWMYFVIDIIRILLCKSQYYCCDIVTMADQTSSKARPM